MRQRGQVVKSLNLGARPDTGSNSDYATDKLCDFGQVIQSLFVK